MVSYFKEVEYWSYFEPISVCAAFGNFKEFPIVGRKYELNSIWNEILYCNSGVVGKQTALYFQASPGLGKTYLLRKIFLKQCVPEELKEDVQQTKFLALDFNRNACDDAMDFKDDFEKHSNLFALSRLYYVNFAVQSRLNWIRFLRKAVVPLIRSGFSDDLEELMVRQLRAFKGESRCVILVDEIMKTEELGVNFANRVRSEVCKWMDKGQICNTVLFTSLDANFMTQEVNASGRAVLSVTTLPLLDLTESISLLDANIKAVFVDGEGNSVKNREIFVRQLALASGGHPRAAEFMINHCNNPTGSVKTRSLKEIIDYAARLLCAKYREVHDWPQLYQDVLLGERVHGSDLFAGGESYRSLVMRGVLIDSFSEDNPSFIPTVPELYLHRWILRNQLEGNITTFLSQILETRYKFIAKEFESIHSSWEKMMRYVRQGKPRYLRIPLNDLYCLELPGGAAPITRCLVDGSSILTEIEYKKGTKIKLQPNTIYNPANDDSNPGWDRLIVLEAFPVSSGSNSSKRYLLPLFIQNKFSSEDALTMLGSPEVNIINDNCKKFMKFITFDSEFSPIQTADDKYVLLLVAKRNNNANIYEGTPSNVMLCLEENLEKLYGPTLKGFVSSLQPGPSVSVKLPA
jgi:hypothetical protein